MRLVSMLFLFAAIAAAQSAQEPAKLEVMVSDGSLSYKVINQSPSRIVGFDIYTQFTSNGSEISVCGVNANVKPEKDFAVAGVCQLPDGAKSGKSITYTSRIVRVEFENGRTWTSPRE